MKTVGVKALKNKLSSYLDLVRGGERVLVTDRDEVIAEIRRPTLISANRLETFLADAQASGAISLPVSSSLFPQKEEDLPASVAQDVAALLEGARKDRY